MSEGVNEINVGYLVNNRAGHPTFNFALKQANEETIRAALHRIGAEAGKSAPKKALKDQLKKLLETQGEQVTATETRHTRNVALDVTTLQAERNQQLAVQEEQKERERLIAQCHEVIGQIKGFKVIAQFADVGNLVWLKQVKESKIYKNLPDIGTWEKFCDYIGMSRQKVDEDLMNLAIFGESFLADVGRIGLGYRELRQLRQLKYDGESFQMSDDGKTVIIEGETIALGEDAGAEIEAALEKLLVKNKTLRERNGKLEKDLKGAVKEETAGLLSEKKALLERVQALEVFEPKEDDREWSIKQMERIEEAAGTLQLAIAGFIVDPRMKEDRHLQAQVDAYLREAEMALHDVRGRMDEVIDMFNN